MAIKYVRKDFREHAKGAHRDLPPVQRPMLPFPKTRWKRVQIFSLLILICLLFILDGLQRRREALQNEVTVTEGIVVGKSEADGDTDDGVYTVDLELPLEGEESASVEAVCGEELWRLLEPDTPVQVRYYTMLRDGQLVIQSITPIDDPESAGAPVD